MFWLSRRGRFGRQLDRNLSALRKGDYGRIPRIFSVLAERHAPSKLVAAQALAYALERLGYDETVRIDAQMRHATTMEWSIDWRKRKIDDLITPDMSYQERRAVIIFASFNCNGYIREQAALLLKDYDHTLAYIILRLNDWTQEVWEAAENAYGERLNHLCEGELSAALPYALGLKCATLFIDKLTRHEQRADFETGLQCGNERVRRFCIGALLASSRPDEDLTFRCLRRERDPVLRSRLFRKLCLLNAQMDDDARVLLRDKLPANRILARGYLHDAGAADIEDILTTRLLDKNASVRASARNMLRQDGSCLDFRMYYIAALGGGSVAAIAGLGETGRKEDAPLIERFVNDDRAGAVRAALASLMGLDANAHADLVVAMMGDSRRSVIHGAQRLIMKHRIRKYGAVHEVFQSTPYEYTKVMCAAILFSAPKWDSLIYMLEALRCDAKSVRDMARRAITRWLCCFSKSAVQPGAQQCVRIRLLLGNLEGVLSDSVKRELRFALDADV